MADIPDNPIDPDLLQLIKAVTAKRPRTVLDHILQNGVITTDELKQLYGYSHPPRAARDVREWGIPLVTTQVKGPDGRTIAAYRLGDPRKIESLKTGGRRAFPKALKTALATTYGDRCCLCGAAFPTRALQIDHRVPYTVSGDIPGHTPARFMLLCGNCNRSKSWSCEHCENWSGAKDPSTCGRCYWASPERYSHIALIVRRTLTVTWEGPDVEEYDWLREAAERAGVPISKFARNLLKQHR